MIFKRNYPASVLAAVFAVVANKQMSMRSGTGMSRTPSFVRETDAEYEVVVTEGLDTLVIRMHPHEQLKWRKEMNLKRFRDELHSLKPALNERIDPKHPNAAFLQGQKDEAARRKNDLDVAIRTLELEILDIETPSEERFPIDKLAEIAEWTVYPVSAPVEWSPEPIPVESDDTEDPLMLVVEDAYNHLRQVPLPEGAVPLAPWEAVVETDTVVYLRSEIELFARDPETTPETRHAAWVKSRMEEGWDYGHEIDEEGKKHPLVVAYDQLPAFVKERDAILVAAAQSARVALGLVETEKPKPPKPEATKTEKPKADKPKANAKSQNPKKGKTANQEPAPA